ncbi:MAG: amidohydrolase [Aigarchaeota archaeon]|nr:amidohydrolase [Candidatus Pelearchaeum maunauluense]
MPSERTLIRDGLVVTMDAGRRVVGGGAVMIEGDRIAAVGGVDEVLRYGKPDRIIEARNSIVMPGLICAHTHLYGIALRGAALNIKQPSDFLQILQRVWWPLDEKLNNDDAYATALAACMEFALSGTTTFADTYSAPNGIEGSLDRIAEAVNRVGIRGVISFEATERRSEEEGRRGLGENIRFLKRGDKGRAIGMISLHASFTISDDLIRSGVEAAEKYNAPLTIHVSEGPNDVYHNIERYGKRTVERLRDVGLLSERAVLAHCVHLSVEEIKLLSETKTNVAHNPMSNMLNAVGVQPLPEMLANGVNVSLGNDGYVFDMFENMRSCFLLHRVARRDPGVVSAQKMVEMATVDAARAYGLRELGSLEPGKKADIIIIRPKILATPLTGSPYNYIVNGIKGGDVTHVFVDGELIAENQRLLKVAQEEAEKEVLGAVERLWERLGASPPEAVEPLKLK